MIEESTKMVTFSKGSLEKSVKELQKALDESKEFDTEEEYQNAKKILQDCTDLLGK